MATLYVGVLHADVTNLDLYEAFSECEGLYAVRVCRDSSTGRSLGDGYVRFHYPYYAERAIEVKNHSTLKGKAIRVSWPRRDSDVRRSKPAYVTSLKKRRSKPAHVFIKNLNDTIDSAKLEEMFQKFGNILSCKVKGSGFVQFETEDSADAAIEELNGSGVGGKQRSVGQPSPDKIYTNLFIKNLDLDISEEHLREKCSEFGKIISLGIPKDKNGGSKGSGYVNFENPDDARRAVEAMNGSKLGCKILHVARAQKKTERKGIIRKEDRQAQLQLNHAQGFAGPTGSSA